MKETKQVKIKIEEFGFDGTITIATEEETGQELTYLMFDFFGEYLSGLKHYEGYPRCPLIRIIATLHEGESRDSIIKALFELQKSLLNENWYSTHYDNFDLSQEIVIGRFEKTLTYTGDHLIFYDPESRIITITSWEA